MNESATTTRGKPTLIPIPVDGCVLWGRDSIFLDKTGMPNETTLCLSGSFNTRRDRHCYVDFEITFTGIHYLRIMEEDFYFPEPLSEADCEGESTTFGWIEHSRLVDEFRELDSASKMDDKHRQFVFYTYDTAYELVAYDYELVLGKSKLSAYSNFGTMYEMIAYDHELILVKVEILTYDEIFTKI